VFGDVTVSGSDEDKRNWDQIKAAERAAASAGGPVSALDGVPVHQPALSLAAQLLRRAERAGAPAELAGAAAETSGSDLGQQLFDLVYRARALGLDPELELRSAALAYGDRVRAWEASQSRPG
jgi:XTP/dITP diphosphohydrolase